MERRKPCKKGFKNSLYNLAKKYKVLSNNKSKVINYLLKSYARVIAQNKGNAQNVAAAMRNVTPHIFGEHGGCGQWCGAANGKYKFKCLPRREKLCDENLRKDLSDLFEIHA